MLLSNLSYTAAGQVNSGKLDLERRIEGNYLVHEIPQKIPWYFTLGHSNSRKSIGFLTLTPASQMQVGCSGTWGLVPPTQTRVGRTPHKPALLATQPRAPPAKIQPPSKLPHTEQEFNGKTKTVGRGGRRNTKNTPSTKTPRTLSKVKLRAHVKVHA